MFVFETSEPSATNRQDGRHEAHGLHAAIALFEFSDYFMSDEFVLKVLKHCGAPIVENEKCNKELRKLAEDTINARKALVMDMILKTVDISFNVRSVGLLELPKKLSEVNPTQWYINALDKTASSDENTKYIYGLSFMRRMIPVTSWHPTCGRILRELYTTSIQSRYDGTSKLPHPQGADTDEALVQALFCMPASFVEGSRADSLHSYLALYTTGL